MTGATAVKVDNVPLVFVGYGVTAPERQWDDYKGVDLKGKIGIVLVNDPDFETGQGDFGGKAMTYYGRWTYKYEEAARRGAVGMLVVHETGPASYGWETVRNSNTNTMFDIVRANPAEAHPQIEGWIQRDVAVDLFAARPRFRGIEEGGADPGLQAGRTEGRGFQRGLRRVFAGDHVTQRGRPDRRHEAPE